MWQPILVFVFVACRWAPVACGRSRLLDGNDPLGSPGELAWQAWLLMDGASGAGGEAGGARRITPKSVFIAPAFAPQSLPPCADGTKRDAAGRCVQLVHINRDAQLNFLLQRLNALHARPAPPRIFPAPLRPLPPLAPLAPARAPDAGPFKVPLRVPLPTVAPEPSTTPSTTPTPPEDVTASSLLPPTSEPTVVMADLSKRSSAEDGTNDTTVEHVKPMITVWTLENNTFHKTKNVEGDDATFTVELPATTTEAGDDDEEGEEAAGEMQTSPKDVLAPSEVEDALPMLVIRPGTTFPASPTTGAPETQDDEAVEQEGSGERSQDGADAEEESEVGGWTRVGTTTEQVGEDSDTVMKEDDREELGSADVTEHIEVVPISEHSRHKLPIMGEDPDQDTSFSQAGFSGMMRPFPLEVLHGLQQQGDETPIGDPIQFPPDTSDEPHTVHLFKGNYIKFPIEQAYRYKHKPVTEPQADIKPSFSWLPSSWRIDQQRHQPAPQDFWSRMPDGEDSSLLSQYNPPYHSPLPYQQRQAQYDPQWSTMKKQMTS